MSPLEAQVALNMLPGIGPIRCRRLIEQFCSAREILNAGRDACLSTRGIGPEIANTLEHWQDHCDPPAEIAACKSRGIELIAPWSDLYPPLLREAYDAPILLYCLGELKQRDHQALGIIGSRRCSHYGLQTARKLAYQLAGCGQTIVSGLARGIDTAAHEAAIAAEGRTIAILGSGLAHLYPAENEALAERIAEGHGAVISEYPLHTRPDKHTFPVRNRIIAAWSQALIVVECPDKSGALITANLANDYGRPTFVVPGPIDRSTFCGSHRLIRDGATLITDGQHVLDDLGGIHLPTMGPPEGEPMTTPHLSDEQLSILNQLSSIEMTTDELIEACALPAPKVTRSLALLEIHGLVKSLPGARYVRS